MSHDLDREVAVTLIAASDDSASPARDEQSGRGTNAARPAPAEFPRAEAAATSARSSASAGSATKRSPGRTRRESTATPESIASAPVGATVIRVVLVPAMARRLPRPGLARRHGQMLPPYDSRETLERVALAIRETGARIHVVHVSSAGAVPPIAASCA